MNPEHRGNESKTSNRQTKASLPARKTCLFCPPTKHDTKLDQLNKAKETQASKTKSFVALFFFFFWEGKIFITQVQR